MNVRNNELNIKFINMNFLYFIVMRHELRTQEEKAHHKKLADTFSLLFLSFAHIERSLKEGIDPLDKLYIYSKRLHTDDKTLMKVYTDLGGKRDLESFKVTSLKLATKY